MKDLSFITTQELLAELTNRFPLLIMAGMRNIEIGSSESRKFRSINGDATLCRGLCAWLEDEILILEHDDGDEVDMEDL